MTLAEIFADAESLPAGVEPVLLNGESFALWEIVGSHGTLEVTFWLNGEVMMRKHMNLDEAYPSSAYMFTPEQMIWLGSLPGKLSA